MDELLTGQTAMAKSHSGRPARGDRKDIPNALRCAASQAIVTNAGGDFTVSEVAASAGVDPAMVNYYFINKSGLISSIIDDALLVVFKKLTAIERQVHRERSIDTRRLIEIVSRHYFNIAPFVRQLLKEVGNAKSETHRSCLERDERNFRQIEAVLRACVACGVYRSDLHIRHAALSLTCLTAGLTCFPHTFINPAPTDVEAGRDRPMFTFEELIANGWLEQTSAMLDREFRSTNGQEHRRTTPPPNAH